MEGTVRTYAPETQDVAENAIRRIVSSAAEMYGCTAELDYDRIEPCVCNADTALNDIARDSARTLYGEEILRPTERATGSEDFSYLMEKIPSSLFVFLGCYEEESGCVYPVHNEKFRINEDILPVGAAQYAQRLALRRSERFLAVHAHIASSFDVPVKKGASLLWCVTTGENELGYARSRKFFRAARDLYYPIVYKAYPGLGHEGNAKVTALGFACFDYALKEYERATKLNGGKPTMPDWADIFSSSPSVADIFNQAVYSKFDYLCVPVEFRMLLPEPLLGAWSAE